ncbi:uncharacterized protein LOC109599000 isoform X3 [Aethina tumida]|uniref:uncharacterized protein LOC109599000 isoform X3 n=1 Tax=Aethina tumida TaxID=116153 RepID=UPI00096B23DD|nr:uncharacterized protein LOC109599000 isoform X3 [Aethina tumida]
MVMDQFVTTYRKDFLWPYVRTFGIRPEPTNLFQVQYRDPNQVCACHCLEKPKSPSEQHQLVGPLAVHEESWSRQGPMGPLLNPKMYPAKVAEKPETSPAANYNQPNVFLHKLQEKYPFVYECLRQAPPSDMLARINRDRLRTTYQVDFCKMREHVSGGNKKAMYEARGPKEIVCPPRKIPKRKQHFKL